MEVPDWSPDPADIDYVSSRVRAAWQQGDVATFRSMSHIADLERPLTPAAGAAAARGVVGVRTVLDEVEAVVIVTQTCDVVRDADSHPYVEVSPLVRLQGHNGALGRAGRLTDYAHVPGIGEDAFAYLAQVVSVEKAVFAGLSPRRGCRDEGELRRFGSHVARRHGRFAFPTDFVRAVEGLRKRIVDKHGKNSAEGRAAEALWKIRATPDPNWAADQFSVRLDFILPPRETALADGQQESADAEWPGGLTVQQWDEQVEAWLSRCVPNSTVQRVTGMPVRLDDVNPTTFYFGDELDLDHLSE